MNCKKYILSLFILFFLKLIYADNIMEENHIAFSNIIKKQCDKYNLPFIILEEIDINNSFSFLHDELIDRIGLHELIKYSGLHYTIVKIANKSTLIIGKLEQLYCFDNDLKNNNKILLIGISKQHKAWEVANYLIKLFDLKNGITANNKKNEIYLNKILIEKNMCKSLNNIFYEDLLEEIKYTFEITYIKYLKYNYYQETEILNQGVIDKEIKKAK